tara:strand:+ start:491 stop:757 length:267 start_codon:yes stop_codon:yes gene_type:complete
MYKYIATEHSVDVRHFEIVSSRELSEEEITDAMSLPDINVEGSCSIINTAGKGVKVTYTHTEFGDDSHVDYYLESFKHTIELLEGGKA